MKKISETGTKLEGPQEQKKPTTKHMDSALRETEDEK